jgi:hypothetical protein
VIKSEIQKLNIEEVTCALFSLNEIHCKMISTAYDSSMPKKKKKEKRKEHRLKGNNRSNVNPFYPSSLQEGDFREVFIVLWIP